MAFGKLYEYEDNEKLLEAGKGKFAFFGVLLGLFYVVFLLICNWKSFKSYDDTGYVEPDPKYYNIPHKKKDKVEKKEQKKDNKEPPLSDKEKDIESWIRHIKYVPYVSQG